MKQRWSKRKIQPLRTFLRRGALLVLVPIMALTITVSPLATQPANAQGIEVTKMLGGSITNGLSTCAIETVGWVICPTMLSIARLADYGFTYINTSFLKLDYSLSSDTSGTYKAWEIMRNIANALFVVAFMVLIYSQLTGRTSGGYSIKRLLPRLIICAILVNLSYFLCQVLVEGSNIIGGSILQILNGLSDRIGPTVMEIGTNPNALQNGTLSTITSSMMATKYVWVLLAPIAAVTISIATITAAALILLILRKVVVAMLILAAPILFVAYLMPNLERFFLQGLRLFIQLLMIYPIIALLLGAGQIVSATITSIGTGDTGSYRVTGDGYSSGNSGSSGSAVTDLTAAAAAVVPLLGVWFLFKGMNNIMSTAGSRLSASVAGRRGGGDDKKARVTGKASSGAANLKNTGGIGNLLGRKQGFNRNRRRRSASGSSLTGDDGMQNGERLGAANRKPIGEGNAALQESILGRNDAGSRGQGDDIENAKIAGGEAGDMNVENAVAAAMAANQEQGKAGAEQEKQKTAKDIFNNLNRGHEAKDKDRKFNAGPAPAGSGQASGGSAQPSAPVASYKAPNIAQGGNIVTGGAPQQPVQVIAVPVSVDASAFLNQNNNSVRPPDNMSQPPISGTEEKAKARAQKYLFDTDQSLENARNETDILNRPSTPTEPPHTSTKDGPEERR